MVMMINEKCFNMSSAYTRMITRMKHPGPDQTTPFWSGGTIYDALDLSDLYFHTLNLRRFPYSAIASQYLATYMLTNQPDIILFQEISDKLPFAYAMQVINSFCGDFLYRWWFSPNRVYRSYNVICWKTSLTSNVPTSQLDSVFYFDPPYVLRPPVLSDFYIGSDFIRLINVHGAPYGTSFETEKKAKFFKRLSDYITAINSTYGVLIFGDFNVNFSGIYSYFDSNVSKIPFDVAYNGIDYCLSSSLFGTLIPDLSLEQKYLQKDVEDSGLYPDWSTDFSDHYPVRLSVVTL